MIKGVFIRVMCELMFSNLDFPLSYHHKMVFKTVEEIEKDGTMLRNKNDNVTTWRFPSSIASN